MHRSDGGGSSGLRAPIVFGTTRPGRSLSTASRSRASGSFEVTSRVTPAHCHCWLAGPIGFFAGRYLRGSNCLRTGGGGNDPAAIHVLVEDVEGHVTGAPRHAVQLRSAGLVSHVNRQVAVDYGVVDVWSYGWTRCRRCAGGIQSGLRSIWVLICRIGTAPTYALCRSASAADGCRAFCRRDRRSFPRRYRSRGGGANCSSAHPMAQDQKPRLLAERGERRPVQRAAAADCAHGRLVVEIKRSTVAPISALPLAGRRAERRNP